MTPRILWQTFIRWPADKQLTLIFPLAVTLTALLAGDVRQWQPTENKAALSALVLLLLLVVSSQLAFRRHWLAPRSEWLLREFWPVPAMLIGYLTMRVLRLELVMQTLAIPLRDNAMLAFDQALFGNALPVLLQPVIGPRMSLWMESSYLHFYYALPIGLLLLLFWRQQDEYFLRLRKAVLYTLTCGFVLYFFVPVRGPGDAMAHLFSVSLGSQNAVVYDAVNSFRYAYDCFPSLHTAIPWVTLLTAWPWLGWPLRLLALLMTLSITLSTLYLRYHYGADVVAGILLALVIAGLLKRPAIRVQDTSISVPADCA